MQKIYPFKFLDAYNQEDSDIFFGRKEEIETLYEMVFQADLLLVYGASGVGKTSLIQCGLASKFQSHDWLAISIRRANNINVSFEKKLEEVGGILDLQNQELDWLEEDLTIDNPTTTTQKLSPFSRRIKSLYLQHFKPIYLIFDQFEEIYILGDKEEQRIFIETIKEVLKVEQPVKIIISIREEYLGYLYEFEREVPELFRKKLRVEPMNLSKVKTVINSIGQLPQSNVTIKTEEADALAEQVFNRIRGKETVFHIQLPYLQVFLDKLYLQITGDELRKATAVFSLKALEKMGNIGDVLRNFLNEQVLKIAQQLQQPPEIIWKVLSPLVTLEGTKIPSNTSKLKALLPNLKSIVLTQILQALANKRIIRYAEKEQFYEIAHDSLAQQIHNQRSSEEIALLEVQWLIKSQMTLNANSREYFSEKQLNFIEVYLEKLTLSKEEEEHLEKSRQEVQRIKNQSKRRTRLIIISTLTALLFMTALAWSLSEKQKEIEKEKIRVETLLVTIQKKTAEKELLSFESFKKNATSILEKGGCPDSLMMKMNEIANAHIDSSTLKNNIRSLLNQYPNCQ